MGSLCLDGLSGDMVDDLTRIYFFSLFIQIEDVSALLNLMMDFSLWSPCNML